jgi:GNAT superfamily N-acetyltransferase
VGYVEKQKAKRMSDLQIRDAHDTDRDAIRDVTLAAFHEYEAILPPAHWGDYRRDILDALVNVWPAQQIVAEQDGAIVGSVLLYPAGSVFYAPDGISSVRIEQPEVRLLAVAPAARGEGIGTALMQECVRRARLSKASTLTLRTSDMMRAAVRMYDHMGFERAPGLDYRPVPGVTIKGYRLNLDEPAPST